MANTIVTVFDEVRAIIDKYDAQIDDATVKRVIYRHISATSGSYTFQQATDDIWVIMGNKHMFLLNPEFTGEDGATYTINASGSIELTAGTDVRASITVTGARVRLYAAVAEILTMIATTMSDVGNVSFGGTSISSSTVRSELMAQASHYAQMDELLGI